MLKINILIEDAHLFFDICINKIRIIVRINVNYLFQNQSIEFPKIRIQSKPGELILHSREYLNH